jgi:hypothetical protein
LPSPSRQDTVRTVVMRTSIVLVAVAVVIIATLALADKPKPAPPAPIKTAPLRYFEDRCSRCHGPFGSFYGDQFGKGLSEEALRKVVEDMCRVQGDSPLAGQDLEAQIAFHRALIANEPFLVVTDLKAGELSGEVSEKATVSARFKRSSALAEVKGTTWKVAVPKGARALDAVITATVGKGTSILTFANASFTHGPPSSTARK